MDITIFRRIVFALIMLLMAIPSRADGELIYPDELVTRKGAHSDQPLTVLAIEDQMGQDDNWNRYKAFYTAGGGYNGIFTYSLPPGLDKQDVAVIELLTNYRGASRAEQRWRWLLRDFTSGKWKLVGDNQNAGSWIWTSLTFAVPGDPTDYIDDAGRLQLRYYTKRKADDSDLDYLALRLEPQPEPPPPPPPPPPGEIWQPLPGSSWQIQLQGDIDTTVDAEIFDIDLFDVPQATIDALHGMGRKVICYFSAGSWEDWRPDAGDFSDSVKGRKNGWPGERWLDIRQIDVLAPIMRARFDLAVAKSCDAVDPDNVDAYTNKSGFPLGYQDQLAYNSWLAAEAHARGLSVGLKNDLNQIEDLLGHFDWALNEQCFRYNECELLLPFVVAGKAVFGVEYQGSPESFCPQANAMGMDFLNKRTDLYAWRIDCHDY